MIEDGESIQPARQALLRGDPLHAQAVVQARLRHSPDDVDALEVAALAAIQLRQPAVAEAAFRHILQVDPEARWARADLARLLIDLGRPDEADAELHEALGRDPTFAEGHVMLAYLFAQREALIEAGWHFERAIALGGRDPDLLVNLGRTLQRRGELAAAATLAQEAASRAPDLLGPAILAADVAELRGDFAAANRWLDRAEPLARRDRLDVSLARARVMAGGEQWRDALAMLERATGLSGGARLLRGRLRERAGRFAEAWDDFVAGKATLARPHDRAAVDAHFAELSSAFRPDLPVASLRTDVPQPIFVLGPPRSGTTLTEQILSAHSLIRAGGELPFVREMADLAGKLLGQPFPRAIGTIGAADRRHIPALLRDFYLARAETYGLLAPGAAWFVDKMPLNEAYLPLIRLAFPAAPLILLRRHPLDVLLSAMSHNLTHGFNAFYAPADAAHHLAATARLVGHWRDALGIAPHVLGYERLATDPTGEIARMMAHIGHRAEPAQAEFHRLDRHAPTPSHAQVRQPMHTGAIGRWKRFAPQLAPYIPSLEATLHEGGYDVPD